MKKTSLVRPMGLLTLLLASASFLPVSSLAQGPAGAGAAEAAGGGSSSRSYNPTKWFGKKDAKSAASGVSPDEADKKLEGKLRMAQALSADASLKNVCRNFLERVDCVAALYASHNLGLNFECLRSNMTGVRTDADATSCKAPDGDKPLNLMKTIRLLKPDADAKSAAKEAEAAARQDVKDAAS